MTLRLDQARRVAVRAQRLDQRRNTAPLALLRRLGAIQIDSVNVVARAHYLPFFARIEAPRAAVDSLFNARTTTEYWAHEASLIAREDRDLFAWRMRSWQDHAWGNMLRTAADHPGLLDMVEVEVAAGPGTSRELEARLETDHPRDRSDWGWNWSIVKSACEALFWSGRLSTSRRNAAFERVYVPGGVPDIDDGTAAARLVAHAVQASGVADRRTIKDYYRLPPAIVDLGITQALGAGTVQRVDVAGRDWYADPHLTVPRHDAGTALLGPFDPSLWDRTRVEQLFGFRHRLEIYVPEPKREFGYYVLPFLFDGHLVARVDLKADRQAGVLRVRSAHAENDAPTAVAQALTAELHRLADWLGMTKISSAQQGNLDLPLG
ncbi:MAG: winged helix DNA-binding domain-containing protein [Candidatus Nanopelagicales bacterium]|jgi:uncharacterized protein YcaQ|nr:winged helix DNA-binding domain-containing protein [Candidatus Nanopelagicales bacterium]MCU0298249.1 winged helix DNA-binding domain-containing protein [Candidatus Nanopelagicales bacterium]